MHLHNAEQMLPHLEPIELVPDPLPNIKKTNVICYDFVPQLLSILQNQKMMAGNNLVLDPSNPLAMYKPADNRICEALSYRRLVSNPSKQLLCPLICYTDGTQIDSLSWFGVERFLFMPAVLSHVPAVRLIHGVHLDMCVQHLKSNLRSDNCKLLSSSAKARKCIATYSHTRMLRVRKPSVRQPICLAPKLCVCAYANTVPCVRQHRLPPLLVTVTSVPVTDPIAVVDPTRELLLECFLSVDLCGSGTNLF
jgi:hypothetical protein